MKSIRTRLEQKKRPLIILLTLASIAALFLLATGLDTIQFAPAQPFEVPRETSDFHPPFQIQYGSDLVFVILFGILLLLALIVVLRSPEQRKLLAKHTARLLILSLVVIALWILSTRESEEPPATEEPPPATALDLQPLPDLLPDSAAPETIIPPAPSPWLSYATTLLVIALLAAGGFALWSFTKPPEEPLRDITELALRDLAAGRSWEDSVIKCYIRMSKILQERRAVYRNIDMTPSEFILHLEKIGLPSQPVQKLTRLFEKARYSAQTSGTTETSEAIACLTEILQALEETQ